MKFMDGVAIPLTKMDEVCKKMGEVQTEFDALRTTFIANYNAAIDSWCKENPQYETVIRSGALPTIRCGKAPRVRFPDLQDRAY
jgi:hypothetical protein